MWLLIETYFFLVLSMENLDHRCFPRKILLEVLKILYVYLITFQKYLEFLSLDFYVNIF